MTVAADRTLNNNIDVNRKIPESAIDPGALNGLTMEKIVGPASGAKVSLSQPAESIQLVMSYITANGNLVAVEGAPNVVNAFKLEGTHWSAVLEAVSGVAELTEGAAEDNSANTWVVFYTPKAVSVDTGGQSVITP